MVMSLSAASCSVMAAAAFAMITATSGVRREPPVRHVSPEVDTLLAHLIGHWRMRGDVRGKPATYDLDARYTLRDRYVELHMVDVAVPSAYEARVLVGADTANGHVIVHWLDNFGAAYSVPPGYGTTHGDTLRVEFAYPTGAFRDTFIYNVREDSWDVTLLSETPAKTWSRFAHYSITRM
jgi:hypothetical protein